MSRSDLHETAYRIFELTALSKSDVIGDPVSKMCAFQLFEAARMFKLFREREWFSLGSADQLEKISIASAVYSDKLRSDMYEVVELEGGGTAPVHVAAADLLTDISKILAAANFSDGYQVFYDDRARILRNWALILRRTPENRIRLT